MSKRLTKVDLEIKILMLEADLELWREKFNLIKPFLKVINLLLPDKELRDEEKT